MGEGSSPLTRGKPRWPQQRPRTRRLIPAHAGKTRRLRYRRGERRAHPRSRGENIWNTPWSTLAGGSSPLTRGKRVFRRELRRTNRLIPAHAGKTARICASVSMRTAHPRSRGENYAVSSPYSSKRGSSPLTRGKPHFHGLGHLVLRLIPAHAGKTFPEATDADPYKAHPRSRGENSAVLCQPLRQAGSSPLTRGKRLSDILRSVVLRLIPAHAGKTEVFGLFVGALGAHPRSRGENSGSMFATAYPTGSSPLTRGKRQRIPARAGGRGLIPAHAGKTSTAHARIAA